MTDVSLAELLASVEPLAHGADEGAFRVRSIPGHERHYVGRNGTGHPSLLLASAPGAGHFREIWPGFGAEAVFV